jgi:hypothetical protein
MKIAKSFLHGMFAVATTLSMSSVALAETQDTSAITKQHEMAMESFTQHLTDANANEALIKAAKLDDVSDNFIRIVGGEYFPIFFSKTYFMTSLDGNFFARPTGTYIFHDGRVMPASTVLDRLVTDSVFSKKDKMLTHELPEGVQKKGDLYLITDPTCGYCKKAESDIDAYLESGLVVHYIAFPRSGVAENQKLKPGFTQWEQAICSDAESPAKAYREITLGRGDKYQLTAEQRENCDDSIIVEGYAMGQLLGIGGTPYMHAIMDNGKEKSAGGYLPYEAFQVELGLERQEVKQPEPVAETQVETQSTQPVKAVQPKG